MDLKQELVFNLQYLPDSVFFRLGAATSRDGPPTRRLDYLAASQVRAAVLTEFGLDPRQSFNRIALDDPRLPALLNRVEVLNAQKQLGFRGSGGCWIEETLIPDSTTEWYCIEPQAPFERADRVVPGRELRGGRPYGSERFLAAVKAAGLTGLGTRWWKDRSTYRSVQWFEIFAFEPLGRGLDHPWFDVQSLTRSEARLKNLDPAFRSGIVQVWGSNIRLPSGEMDPLLLRAFQLADPSQFSIRSYRRYLRAVAPATDFAYWWDSKPVSQRPADGPGDRFRKLACNARAASALMKAGVLRTDEIVAIQMLDDVPVGTEHLDASAVPVPAPVFTKSEYEVFAPRNREEYRTWQGTPLPERSIDIEQVMPRLKELSRRNRAVGDRSEIDLDEYRAAEQELGVRIPQTWKKVVPLLGSGFMLDGEGHELGTYGRFVQDVRDQMQVLKEQASDAGPGLVYFASSSCGDAFFFDTASPLMPSDCPVLKLNHETMNFEGFWPTIAAFVEETLPPDTQGKEVH